MKKHLISILFAFVLGVIFCVSASATEADITKAEKWVNEAHSVTGMISDLTVITDYASSTQRLYSKGEKAASDIEINGKSVRLITDSKDLIIFSPDMPLFHVKFKGLGEAMIEIPEGMPTEFSLDFVKAYEHTEGDKTYYIEEFTDEEGILYKYYFVGDELIFMDAEITSGEVSEKVRIVIISYEVDDEVFEIPWYSIDIYPIVMILAILSLI